MTKILIIEDDQDMRSNIEILLEQSGYDVYCSSSGKEGLKLVDAIKPDLIICDVMMANGDGYFVKNELEKNEDTRDIPFIFLTAKVDLLDLRKGMNLGADDYIFKPYDSKDLLRSVNIRLQKKQSNSNGNTTDKNNADSSYKYDDKILVKIGNSAKFIEIKEIKSIEADNQYTKIVIANLKHIHVLKSLLKWEEVLPDKDFLRIHRSAIINVNQISKIEYFSKGAYCIYLNDVEKPYVSSRRYSAQIRSLMI